MTTPSVALPKPRGRLLWGALPTWLRRTLLLGLIVLAWYAFIWIRKPDSLSFASPWETARALWDGWSTGSLARPTWGTLRLLLEGIGVGALGAGVLTALATLTTFGEDLLVLLTSILNPLPGVAMLPLAMLWFGLNERAVLFVIANATIWPIAIAVLTGFRTANQTLVAVGRNIGLSRTRLITDVLAPAALPHAISGIKTAWAFGWRTVIAAELVFGVAGSKGGLGAYINNAQLYLLVPPMFAGLVTIAVLGVVFESLFGALERRTVVRWGMKSS